MNGIYLESDLLRSEAFNSLSKWALKVYLIFLTKRVITTVKSKDKSATRTIANNGEITFCYSEARAKGIAEREFRNAIDELIGKGFLDLTHQGSGGKDKDMSRYTIDVRWKKWNTPEFAPPKMPRQKYTQGGRGWKVYNWKEKQKSLTNMSVENPFSPDKSASPKQEKDMFRLSNMSVQ